MGVSIKPQGVKAEQTSDAGSGTKYEDIGPGVLVGNLTKDPELAYTPAGRAIGTLRIADTERVRDEESGQWRDGTTEYYDAILFAGMAERAAECLRKGDRVVCAGMWQRQTWTDKEGEAREATKLAARDLGASLMFNEVRVQRRQRGGQK